MSTKISNPHDHFIRKVLSGNENATSFFQNNLPKSVTEQLDFSTLTICKDTFIDKELEESRSDLLFQLKSRDKRDVSVYLLFEHKSFVKRLIGLDILRYMVQIWYAWLEQKENENAKHLPVIIPLVLYHGKGKWKVADEFSGIITDYQRFADYTPNFRYALCDLSKYSDEEIKGTVLTQSGLLALKYIFSDDLLEKLPGIIRLFMDIIETESGLKSLQLLFNYLAHGTERITRKDFENALKEALGDKGGGLMPTLAEQILQEEKPIWIQKGMQQGMQKGIIQADQEGIIDIIEARFDRVPSTLVRKINSITDTDLLKHLRRVAVTISSISEFEKKL